MIDLRRLARMATITRAFRASPHYHIDKSASKMAATENGHTLHLTADDVCDMVEWLVECAYEGIDS